MKKTINNEAIDRFFKIAVIILLVTIIWNQIILKQLETESVKLSESLNAKTLEKIDNLKDRIYRKVGNTCITENHEKN